MENSRSRPYPRQRQAIEAFTLGDSIDALVAEQEGAHAKRLLVDNAATVALLGDGPTSWRTRHLKLRAKNLRWRVSALDWKINFVPGRFQVADVGTKPLMWQRLEELKKLMNMGEPPKKKIVENEKVLENDIKTKAALFLCVAASQMQVAGALENEDEVNGSYIMHYVIIGYTILVILLTLVVVKFTAWWNFEKGEKRRVKKGTDPKEEESLKGSNEDFVKFVEAYAANLRQTADPSGGLAESSRNLRRRSSRVESVTPADSRRGSSSQECHRSAEEEHGEPQEGVPSPSFSATSAVPPPSPDMNQNVPERFNVFGRADPHGALPRLPRPEIAEEYAFTVTWTGERYHQDHECPGLQNATARCRMRLCGDCLAMNPFDKQRLYGRPGRLLHTQRQHAVDLEREHAADVRCYTPCKVCGPF